MADNVLPQLDAIQAKLDLLLREASKANQRFLGVADAANFSGLSPESVRRLIAAGKLTPLRPVRGKILVDRRELETLILTSRNKPRSGRGQARAAQPITL